jgi:hypothetical protein
MPRFNNNMFRKLRERLPMQMARIILKSNFLVLFSSSIKENWSP